MTAPGAPAISVVVPVRNEASNIAPLVAEIAAALTGLRFEVIYVSDGAIDGTEAEIKKLQRRCSWLRQLRHAQACGQSAALRTGTVAARGAIVAMLDGDGQNDPAYLPRLIEALEQGGPRLGLVAGQRVRREVSAYKKFQARIANAVRRAILRDGARDTGCGLKVMPRELALALPAFDGAHRFLPALVRGEGREVVYVDVIDRPRRHGISNYGLWNRLGVGIVDLAGVWWLMRRKRRVPEIMEV